MLRKFKVVYMLNGRQKSKEILATSKYNAKRRFYLTERADDILCIEEVDE